MIRWLSLSLVAGLVAAACGPARDTVPHDGAPVALGDGSVAGYATFDHAGTPHAIGVAFSAAALHTLPVEHSDGHRCFDANGDGVLDLETECSGWHERALPLPSEAARRGDLPFKWVLLNWNPHGHIPPGIWDAPHFDVHFYIESIEKVFALHRGTCGPELVRCDQFAQAIKPVPANYMHPDYVNVGAVAPAMGNHLIDTTAAEFRGTPFTRSWIFGTYDGRVTFYEEMLTVAYFASKPDACAAIKSPPAVAQSGYYPTRSCVRYDAARDEYTVSMEDFVYRQAESPQLAAVP